MDDSDEQLKEICKELIDLAELIGSLSADLGLRCKGRTRIMAHTKLKDEDKKQLALPQGVKVDAKVLQDRLDFREQRQVGLQ